MKNNNKHPIADWPWWKITGAALLSFGVFGGILAFLPPYSAKTIFFGAFSVILAIPIIIWNWKVFSWTSRVMSCGLWSLQLLAIGIRAWVYILPQLWILPLVGGYIFAWFLPAINPKLSDVMWREQTTPETKFGKMLVGISVSLAPVAGALAASMGMFTSRFRGVSGLNLVIAPLFTAVSIVVAFAFAYQLWPDRPWARSEKQEAR